MIVKRVRPLFNNTTAVYNLKINLFFKKSVMGLSNLLNVLFCFFKAQYLTILRKQFWKRKSTNQPIDTTKVKQDGLTATREVGARCVAPIHQVPLVAISATAGWGGVIAVTCPHRFSHSATTIGLTVRGLRPLAPLAWAAIYCTE